MSKKTPEPTVAELYQTIIGLDLGYGEVKAANSISQMRMPSIIGAAPVNRYSDEWSANDGDVVIDDQGAWNVGENAVRNSKNIRYTRDRGRTLMPDYKRLMYVALGRLHPTQDTGTVVPINIFTGLPVAHMGDKDALIAVMKGQHRVQTLHTNGIYSVDKVAVAPQPYGALFFNVLDEYGVLVNGDLSASRVLVVDIGRYTTNIILVNRMAYMERASDSINAGMSVIEDHLRKYFESEYNWTDVRPEYLLDIITNDRHTTRVDGETIDLSDPFNEGVADLSEIVIGKMSDMIGAGLDVDNILVAGGGGISLIDAIKVSYPRAFLTAEPVIANALGFVRGGRRQWAAGR